MLTETKQLLIVTGVAHTRHVYVKRLRKGVTDPSPFTEGRELKPARSQKYYNHSPDGFAWGYSGSGPAQLALALCLVIFDHKRKRDPLHALPFDYQRLKWDIITHLNVDNDFQIELDVDLLRKKYALEVAR